MTYHLPSDLKHRVKLVRTRYKRNNPTRLKLIDLLEAISNAINTIEPTTADYKENDLEKIFLAAWIFGLEKINKKSWKKDPIYKEGYFWGWGSTLFSIYSEQLELSNINQIDDKQRFICMEKFYNFLLKNAQCEKFRALLAEKNLKLDDVKEQAKEIIQILLLRLSSNITGILKALPTEKAIDKKMSNLYSDYQTLKQAQISSDWTIFNYFKSENQERIFLTQLVAAFAHLLPAQPNDNETTEHTMTRSQRIKMGLVLYVLQLINNEYHLRTSVLFKLCLNMLNLEHIKDISNHTKLNCISAFKNYFSDNKILELIEKFGHQTYQDKDLLKEIDIKKIQIDKELDKMTSQLLGVDYDIKPTWSTAKTLAQVGALVMASPGYGVGYVLGYSASDTHTTVVPKLSISNTLTYIGTTFLGFTRMGFGFLAADFIVQSTLTRAFAKVLEQMGMLVGYATGSAIGLTIDLSYQGLRNVCKCFLHLYENLYDPILMQNVDVEFVQSLLNLPPEIFSDEKRNKLENLANENDLVIETNATYLTCMRRISE